jgi:diguanylate cyclase (GGDEF)-like protein/PAS domain S-box-containing protein
MNFTGRIIFVSFSFIVSLIESFFEPTNLLSVVEALFFAAIAYSVGWIVDRSLYYRKKSESSEKRYRDMIEFSPEPILIYQDERIVFVNDKLEELLGLRSEQIIGKSIFDYILPEFHGPGKERIQKANAGDQSVSRTELKIRGAEDIIVDIEASSIAVMYDNKPSIEVFLKDITKRKRLEEELRNKNELYRFITENTTDVISYIIPTGDYEYISPSCQHILGYSPNEIVGKNIYHFFHPEEMETLAQLVAEAKTNFDFASFPHRFRKKDGHFIWLETNARTIRNNNRELIGMVAVSRDIDERVAKEKKLLETNQMLLYFSKMDGLTDIPNRRYFEEMFQKEWTRTMRHSMPLSILMIDIDYFKHYNDRYGHLAGDSCIKEIAKTIKQTLKRPGDFAARYGGEEFVILLPETDEKGAAYLAECILANVLDLKIKNDVSDISEFVTVSIGHATIVPALEMKREDLIKQADQQLYSAKESGRNQVK